MAMLDIIFDRETDLNISNLGTTVNELLGLKIQFVIVNYSLTEIGMKMRLSIPDDKVKDVIDILRGKNIRIERSTITVDENLCIDCGMCVSVCAVGALYSGTKEESYKRKYDEGKCVGCKLCTDACPRNAISYQ